jgi:galactose mutarotase-like enzyme
VTVVEPEVVLTAGPARAVLAPHAGGRLASLSVASVDLLVGWSDGVDPLWWGAFPMVPWVGRVGRGRLRVGGKTYQLERTLAPHAVHGVGWRVPWQVDGATESSCRLSCDLNADWPFGGRAVHGIDLDPGGVSLTLEVHAGQRPMPAACGWHPWWRRDLPAAGALEIEVPAEARWERGSDHLPTGAVVAVGDRPAEGWDDCFVLRGPPVLRWPGAVEVTMDTDCPYAVVFDQPVGGVCVEPQTAPPDAFRLGRAAVVEPGTPLVAHTRWSWVLG